MFSVFLGFLIPSLLVREQAFLGLIWSDPIGIFTLSASLGPHIYNVGIIGKQPNKQISQNNQKPQDTHRYVIFSVPKVPIYFAFFSPPFRILLCLFYM